MTTEADPEATTGEPTPDASVQKAADAQPVAPGEDAPPARAGARPRAKVRPLRLLTALAVTPLLRWLIVQHSVPSGTPWRHDCPHCSAPVGLFDAPTVSAVSPLARCGTCGTRVGPPPFSVEIVTLLAAGLLVWARLPLAELPAYAWWTACGIALSFVDGAVHRLPDRLTYPAALGFLALLALPALLNDKLDDWLRAGLAALAFAAVLFVIALLKSSWLGFGDVKYALAIGAATGWIGWFALYGAVFLASLAAAVYGVALVVSRRATWATHLPQGPFFMFGALTAVVLLA